MAKHKSIGNLLKESGLVSEEQIQKALAETKISGKRLGDALIDLKFVTEEQVTSLLSEQMGIPFIDLRTFDVDKDLLKLIDEPTAHRMQVVPAMEMNNSLVVVMIDPLNINAVDELTDILNREVQPVFGTKTAIRETIQKHYRESSELHVAVESINSEREGDEFEHAGEKILDISTQKSSETPAVKLINIIITQAVRDGASDIHFEPNEKSFDIRCRVDGVLTALAPPPKHLQNSMISRLKVLANLDIAEKRKPQDGRVQLKVDNKHIDLRLSTFPTIHGENIVVRILDKSQGILSLDKLGINPDMIQLIEKQLTKPNGIILVTGPTGSGKTTTLYSFLKEINDNNKNIMTMEDPVEYQIQGIRQAHVDIKSGMTFSAGLRSILRQDPDVIMIGEIRDLETAEISIQSSLTGHLVFSTLHTNSASATISRLIDMGIEPFLISSSLSAIISQKLVRKLCSSCKEAYTPDQSTLARFNMEGEKHTFYKEVGCDNCRHTGFSGRVGLYEICVPSQKIRELINIRKSSIEISNELEKEGFISLTKDGLTKVIMGITSLTELFRSV